MTQPWEDIAEDTTLIGKLETWLGTQNHKQAKVSDAASHFGVETIRIEQAAMDSWLLAIVESLIDGAKYVCLDVE
jgi:hypothetical protein